MRTLLNLLVFSMAISLTGCGKKIVTVSGEVQYEGKPAKDVALLFEPKSDATFVAESGVAVTDSSGRFTLESSSDKHGIEPGHYTVYFGWKNPDAVDDVGGAGPPSGAEIQTTVSPYQFPGERNAVVEVHGDGENSFVFKITPEAIVCE